MHGPNTDNFKEIYEYLDRLKVSIKINNTSQMIRGLNKFFLKNDNSKKIKLKLTKIGNKILINTYNEINEFLKNETYKT